MKYTKPDIRPLPVFDGNNAVQDSADRDPGILCPVGPAVWKLPDETQPAKNHSRFRYLEAVPLPLLALDESGLCLFANRQAAKLLNAKADSLVGSLIFDLRPIRMELPESKNARPDSFTLRARFNASTELNLDVTLLPDAAIVTLRPDTWNDIQRKNAFSRKNSLKLLQSMVRLGLWEWQVDEDKVYFSEGVQELLNLPISESGATSADFRALVCEQDRPRLIGAFANRNDHTGGSAEVRVRTSSGNWAWVSIHGQVAERDEKGNPLRVQGVIVDINNAKQHEQENSLFFKISHSIHTAKSLEDFFSLLLSHLSHSLMLTGIEVVMFETKSNEPQLFFRKSLNTTNAQSDPKKGWPSPHLIRVIREAKPRLHSSGGIGGQNRGFAWYGMPLYISGRLIGGMSVLGTSDMVNFTEREIALLKTVAEQASIAIERKRHEDRLSHLALYDSLTGLPNRVLFLERVQHGTDRAQRKLSAGCALLMLDLDRFKAMNDTYGHNSGDAVLKMVAEKVIPILRSTDTVARLGGDEFAIFLDDISSNKKAVAIARRVSKALSALAPSDIKCRLTCSASIGIVLNAHEYSSTTELLEDADIALYHVKKTKRGGIRVFTPGLGNHMIKRLNMDRKQLTAALPTRQFRLLVQPVYKLVDSSLYCMETLLRWVPDNGMVLSPTQFLRQAESMGLMSQIDQWILESTCEMLQRFTSESQSKWSVPVSVNISHSSAIALDFPDIAANVVESAGLPRGLVRIEIPELALATEPAKVASNVHALAEAGIPVLLDGVGTSGKTLDNVHNLPLSALKFSPDFIARQAKSTGGAQSINPLVQLAQRKNMDIIGVGIETKTHHRFAVEMGATAVQGFLLQVPIPFEEALSQVDKDGLPARS